MKQVLYPFDPDFWKKLHSWYQDPKIMESLGASVHTPDQIENTIIQWRSSPDIRVFGVRDANYRPIGFMLLQAIDLVNGRAEMHTAIIEDPTKGLASGSYKYSAFLQTVNYAFQCLHLNRVQTYVIDEREDTEHLCSMLQRMGFSEEGKLREAIKINGEYFNIIIFGVLRSDSKKGE